MRIVMSMLSEGWHLLWGIAKALMLPGWSAGLPCRVLNRFIQKHAIKGLACDPVSNRFAHYPPSE